MIPCPCGLPAPYDACCGRFHLGAVAPTAELLMRSRYSAFALGDMAYLAQTWHPATRPEKVHDRAHRAWTGLDVLAATKGGLLDQEGTVTFDAHYTDPAQGRPGTTARQAGVMHEKSAFTRIDGAWVYLGQAR